MFVSSHEILPKPKMKCVWFVLVLLFVADFPFGLAGKMQEKFAWKQVEFAWESEAHRDEAIASGRYIVENNLPLGLDVWKDKLFITVPRWKLGVASSLNYINLTSAANDRSPKLVPYPSWQANTLETNKSHQTNDVSVISPFRIRADECDRLWVMDTGMVDKLNSRRQIAAPALLIFDLNTDKLIRKYAFTASVTKPATFFGNVIIDVSKNDCDNAYAYVPDLFGYDVVVYSYKTNKSWRVEHHFFYFDPLSGDYNISGVNFRWNDGVFGMALGKPNLNGHRTVYFHALSSTNEFSVPNYVLQNETRGLDKNNYYDFTLVGNRGAKGQSTAEHIDDKTNVMLFTLIQKDAIGCWNIDTPYTKKSLGIVDSDSDSLVFPNDLKVDQNHNVWVLSDRLPLFYFKQLDPTQYNYRVLVGQATELIKGTPCDPNYVKTSQKYIN